MKIFKTLLSRKIVESNHAAASSGIALRYQLIGIEPNRTNCILHIPTGSFEWCPAPYLKGEPQHEHLPHHTAGGKRRNRTALPVPKTGVQNHYTSFSIWWLGCLSSHQPFELKNITSRCISSHLSGLASWHHVLYHSHIAMSIPFWKFSEIFFYTQLIRKCKQIW